VARYRLFHWITIENSSSPQADFGVVAMHVGRVKVTLAMNNELNSSSS
jgi:hypothetical protein